MAAIQVTNYDVLADGLPGGRYSIDDYKSHIGNSRFSVLADMYREAFSMSNSRGDEAECNKIIDRIVGVTCHKDVSFAISKGRFLVKELGDDNWKTLDDDQSKELVRQILSVAPVAEEPLEADTVPSGGLSMNFNDKKRGRRRSLLRRSASESTMLEDKKKTYRLLAGLADESPMVPNIPSFRRMHSAAVTSNHDLPGPQPSLLARQQSVPLPPSKGMVTGHSGMDVVLASNAKRLSSKENIVGNNRLQVMLTLQRARYKQLSPPEQDKVAADLVRAVCQYWGGRILVEQGLNYTKLEPPASVLAIKALLGADEPMLASVADSKPLLSAAPPVPAFLRNASMEILGSNGIGGPQNMQSAAVKSLQQRKAKRAIAKNLGSGRSVPDTFPNLNS